jgi:hypothetical protein
MSSSRFPSKGEDAKKSPARSPSPYALCRRFRHKCLAGLSLSRPPATIIFISLLSVAALMKKIKIYSITVT